MKEESEKESTKLLSTYVKETERCTSFPITYPVNKKQVELDASFFLICTRSVDFLAEPRNVDQLVCSRVLLVFLIQSSYVTLPCIQQEVLSPQTGFHCRCCVAGLTHDQKGRAVEVALTT